MIWICIPKFNLRCLKVEVRNHATTMFAQFVDGIQTKTIRSFGSFERLSVINAIVSTTKGSRLPQDRKGVAISVKQDKS